MNKRCDRKGGTTRAMGVIGRPSCLTVTSLIGRPSHDRESESHLWEGDLVFQAWRSPLLSAIIKTIDYRSKYRKLPAETWTNTAQTGARSLVEQLSAEEYQIYVLQINIKNIKYMSYGSILRICHYLVPCLLYRAWDYIHSIFTNIQWKLSWGLRIRIFHILVVILLSPFYN